MNTNFLKLKYKIIALITAAAAVMGGGLLFSVEYVHASASVTTAATANVSSDSATGASIALPTIVVTEGAAGDVATGTHTFTLPSGYIFDTSSLPTATCTGTGCTVGTITFTGNTALNVPINAASTVAGTLNIGTAGTMKVKASAGNPIAAAGNITMTAGSIAGLSSATNFGTLTQVPGAANRLGIIVPGNAVIGVAFSPAVTVYIQDQYGNTRTSDTNSVTIASFYASTGTATAQPLTGTLTVSAVGGIATFNGVSYPVPDTIQVTATSSGLTSVTSGSFLVSTSASRNALPPSSTITAPSNNAVFQPGSQIIVAGTTKQGSSSIQSVQISFDGGTTWQNAQAVNGSFNNWQYTWLVPTTGSSFTIKTKATDWYGLVETPSTGITVMTVAPSAGQTSTPATQPAGATLSVGTPADGTLVQASGSPTVYLVQSGTYKPFTSAAVFAARGYSFSNIRTIAAIPSSSIGTPVLYPDDTVIKGSGPTVYIVFAGAKQGITSIVAFRHLGLSLKSIVVISDGDLATYPDGGIKL